MQIALHDKKALSRERGLGMHQWPLCLFTNEYSNYISNFYGVLISILLTLVNKKNKKRVN